jgi:hypothetical protein
MLESELDTDVRGGKDSKYLTGYEETNSIHNGAANFILEKVNKK